MAKGDLIPLPRTREEQIHTPATSETPIAKYTKPIYTFPWSSLLSPHVTSGMGSNDRL